MHNNYIVNNCNELILKLCFFLQYGARIGWQIAACSLLVISMFGKFAGALSMIPDPILGKGFHTSSEVTFDHGGNMNY